METLVRMVETVGGLFLALGLWFVFMALVRRRSGCRGDKDLLEYMTHGCAGCKGDGACSKRPTEKTS